MGQRRFAAVWIGLALAGPAAGARAPSHPARGAAATRPAPSTPLPSTRDAGDDQYQFVVGLLERGLPELAVDEARAFLERFGDHPKASLARYRLATALWELGRDDEAARELRALTRLASFDYAAEVWFRLAQCELRAGRPEEAARALERVRGSGAEYLRVPATFLAAELAFEGGDYDAAESLYREVLEAPASQDGAAEGDDPAATRRDAGCGLAWCAFRRGEHDETARRVQAWLRAHRGAGAGERRAEMLFLLGESHLEAGRAAPALEAYGQVGEGEWRDAALRGAGFACLELGDLARAADAFGELVERHPESRFAPEAALQRGAALLRADRPDEALAALSAAGDGPEVRYWRARARTARGDAAGALEELDRALAARPEGELLERLQTARGDVLIDLGRAGDAVRAYGSAGSDYALLAAAGASLGEGRLDEAARLARRLLEQHPQSAYATEGRLTLGEALLAADDPSGAERAFREALESAPGRAEHAARARSRLGWCRLLQDDPRGAAEHFARLVQDQPRSAEAEEGRALLGRALAAAGDDPGAARAFEAYLREHPDGAHAAEARLELARRAGDGARSLELLRAAVAADPRGPYAARAAYELAERLVAAGDPAAASEAYAAIPSADPLGPSAAYGLAWCAFELDRPDEAERALGRALADLPDDDPLRPACHELAVWVRAGRGDAEGALRAFVELSRSGADDARLWTAARATCDALVAADRAEAAERVLGELEKRLRDADVLAEVRAERSLAALDAGRLDEAEALAVRGLQGAPASTAAAEAAFFVGEARFEAGDDERAAELYRAAASVEASPHVESALYKRGFALLRAGRVEDAQASFGAVLERDPASPMAGEVLFLQGECLVRLERWDDAVAVLDRVVQEHRRHDVRPKALFRLGLAHGRREDWAACAQALSELARSQPDFPNAAEAELWRGRALARLGDERGAQAALARAIERDDGVLAARARLELGGLQRRAGRVEEALAEYLKVAVLYAHDEEVADALVAAGGCLEELGDRDRARARYEEAVRDHPDTPGAREAARRLAEWNSL